MTPREIYQTSLRIFNGDKYDKVISQFELDEKYAHHKGCFYTAGIFNPDKNYLVFTITGDLITISTNYLSYIHFELENGRKLEGLERLNYQGGDGHTHPTQIINYEQSLSNVIRYIRNNRINYVLES